MQFCYCANFPMPKNVEKHIIPSRPSPHLVFCSRQFSVPKRETSFHFHLCINLQITDFVCRAGVGRRNEVEEGWDHKNLLEQKPRQTTRTHDAGQGTTVCWWISIKTLLKLFRPPMHTDSFLSMHHLHTTQHIWRHHRWNVLQLRWPCRRPLP